MLQRLLYRSESAFTGTPDEIDLQVQRVIEASAISNKASGVTGALMLTQGVFIQALEGASHAVETVFERICCDLRHRQVRLLELAAAESRIFADWSMVQVTPTTELAKLCPTIGHNSTQLDAAAANAAVQIMRTILLTNSDRAARAAAAAAARAS